MVCIRSDRRIALAMLERFGDLTPPGREHVDRTAGALARGVLQATEPLGRGSRPRVPVAERIRPVHPTDNGRGGSVQQCRTPDFPRPVPCASFPVSTSPPHRPCGAIDVVVEPLDHESTNSDSTSPILTATPSRGVPGTGRVQMVPPPSATFSISQPFDSAHARSSRHGSDCSERWCRPARLPPRLSTRARSRKNDPDLRPLDDTCPPRLAVDKTLDQSSEAKGACPQPHPTVAETVQRRESGSAIGDLSFTPWLQQAGGEGCGLSVNQL